MMNALKAALVPALTMLMGRVTSSLTTASGGYAGIDLNGGTTFAGLQGRLSPPDAPVQIVPSFEGALRSSSSRRQLNADVLYAFSAPDAPFAPYAGGGLCFVRAAEADGSSAGVNLIGGANVQFGSFEAFGQVRLTIADGVHLSLTGGAAPKPS